MRYYSILIILLLLFPGCGFWGKTPKPSSEELSQKALPDEANARAAVTPQPQETAPKKREVLVRLGTREISREEFEKQFADFLLAAETDRDKNITRGEFLEKLILDELLWKYAEEAKIDREPLFRALITREKQKILLDYILETKLSDKIAVIDEEVLWYYNEKIEEFTRPVQIQVRHILTATIEDAQEALRRLDAGEDFADVARDLSIHASRIYGGQLPPFSRGTYNRDFEDAAFPLKVGELSPVIKTDLGYHIIEKTGETPQTTIPFDQVKDEIKERIGKEKQERVLNSFYRQIRNETQVEILGTP